MEGLSEVEAHKFLVENELDTKGELPVLLKRIKVFLKEHPEKNIFKQKKSKKKRKRKGKKTTEEPEDIIEESEEVEITVEAESIDLSAFPEFADILENFNKKGVEVEKKEESAKEESSDEENAVEENKISRSQKKKSRYTVAQLKTIVDNPDLVEWVDVTAPDPMLLITLKSVRNTVPVPEHWTNKKKYLQGKRGLEKPPFELPEYIKATGIMQTRQSTAKSMQGKIRERYHPKLGRMDLDYQKLHDAFFKHQTKPIYSQHGDVYYEGKEFETRLRTRRPGAVSEELSLALNIPAGAPPPWLISMQRYGPPPSYPQLKIPGLNAPIPPGAKWGFHPGGWGKPPTDEYNRPLYGDVFGTMIVEVEPEFVVKPEIEKWGEMVEEESEEDSESNADEDESDEDEQEMDMDEEANGLETPSVRIEGLETPAEIELVKKPAVEKPKEKKELYTIISQKTQKISGFMGSEHQYDIKKGVEVSLNPEDIQEDGVDVSTLEKKYNEEVKEKEGVNVKQSGLGDMVEEFEKGRKRGRAENSRASNKKYKEFKF